MGNWILPGDWIIRSAEEDAGYTPFLETPPFIVAEKHAMNKAFTDHAVYVIDITKTHLTVYDPLAGQPAIVELDRLAGTWHHATSKQVEITWGLARIHRDKNAMFSIEAEMERYPYRLRRKC